VSAVKRVPFALALVVLATSASAKEPGETDYMMRVMACAGEGVSMEIYLPQSLIFKAPGETDNILSMPPTIGWYALDLTGALKGKPLEPVRVSISPDKKYLIVDQYTRGLTTRVPVTGGTVDFDRRFGRNAKCGALNIRE
jgi:hypothetical protein